MPNLTTCLIEITRKTLNIEGEQVTATDRFAEDLGADSFDCVELMMTLEEIFHVEFSDEELPRLTTVDAIADYLRGCAAEVPLARPVNVAWSTG